MGLCSADSVLELYATEGLNPGSVHLAQLRLGQGLVGTIAASARALNLSDAQTHPAFAYLPETGEEIYKSFLGVPVLRAGRTLGVLVVQNRTMAGAVGIDTARADRLTFAVGCGIAGSAFTMIGSTGPTAGQLYIVDTFLVVVFGGSGSLLGTVASAFTISQAKSILEFL